MSSRDYPVGSGALKSRYVDGDLVFFNTSNVEIYRINPTTGAITYASGSSVTFASGASASFAADALTLPDKFLKYAEIAIPAADIVATTAGKLGHASGQPLVAAAGAGTVIELVSAFLIYDYDTAAYTAGGNLTINWGSGGAALTGLVSAANSLGAAGDKIVLFVPLATAGIAMLTNVGLNLVSSAAFTQPGTAAGVVRVKVSYRIHLTDL